ncbi:MAG: mechanosensitive ion channel [Erysipelotrichaceae bacterium]|nr:mechanosensitive ion channel [Erysipelotrichaceae bacterium]
MDTETLKEFLTTAGVNLLFGIIILIVGLFLSSSVIRVLKKKAFAKIDPALQAFLLNAIKLLLYIVVVLSAANVIGIPLTSIITIFASAGVAISLGMQGALGNLVGGLTLMILKPIKIGEYVQIGQHSGMVKNVGAFYTEIVTRDNSLISLPNSSLTNTAIVNYSREGISRVEVFFTVRHEYDVDTVREVLLEMAKKGERVLEDPSPWVLVNKCSETGVEYAVRAWAKAEDWTHVRFYLLENGKRALDEADIRVPYQHLDVHVKQD